uniref:Uncharacterized protein n=1 Tax=Micrurus spixii TaxID=129469 RepID=A0A2D4LFJ9_9SAUR
MTWSPGWQLSCQFATPWRHLFFLLLSRQLNYTNHCISICTFYVYWYYWCYQRNLKNSAEETRPLKWRHTIVIKSRNKSETGQKKSSSARSSNKSYREGILWLHLKHFLKDLTELDFLSKYSSYLVMFTYFKDKIYTFLQTKEAILMKSSTAFKYLFLCFIC